MGIWTENVAKSLFKCEKWERKEINFRVQEQSQENAQSLKLRELLNGGSEAKVIGEELGGSGIH